MQLHSTFLSITLPSDRYHAQIINCFMESPDIDTAYVTKAGKDNSLQSERLWYGNGKIVPSYMTFSPGLPNNAPPTVLPLLSCIAGKSAQKVSTILPFCYQPLCRILIAEQQVCRSWSPTKSVYNT